MRIGITGSRGQLGRALLEALSGEEMVPLDRPEYDITDPGILNTIPQLKPDLVIHTAGMTDVDGCALDPETAFLVNGLGTRNVALSCQRARAAMLYISTNEVFDGTKESPYLELDDPHPINAYGSSKLAGERYVQMLLNRFYIIRTSWLFGYGGNNFVRKILALAEREERLRVVTDEVATPTYASDLAQAIHKLIQKPIYGIYHLTNDGYCSRFDYAARILGLMGKGIPLEPITSQDFSRASKPPSRTILGNLCAAALGITLRPWQEALAEFLRG